MSPEEKMVTCNICLKNKPLEEIQNPFRYVCKDCWNKIKIVLSVDIAIGKYQDMILEKELFY